MLRKELLNTLELVGQALARDDLVPIFKCFCFDGRYVVANNDSICIVAACPTKQAFAVNGQVLMGLLSASQAEEVDFSFDGEDVKVKAGKSIFRLPYFTEDEFIFEAPNVLGLHLKIDAELQAGIKACYSSTSHDLTKLALTAVTFDLGKKVTLYSSDGDTLTRYMTTAKGLDKPDKALVPGAFCSALLKVLDEIGPEASDNLVIGSEWALATFTKYSVYGRLIVADDIDFAADVDQVLSQKPEFAAYSKQNLKGALARARVVADPESAKTMLRVEGGVLKLHTESSIGVVNDQVQLKAPDAEASVSAELMERSVDQCAELAILDNCTVYRAGEQLLQILGNYV
jgi:DNA polymerase III sliding clamp (beta) subunit (PCNA family)